MFYRQAWEDINLDNLDFNLDYIKQKISKKALIAVIKANAYGVGDYQVALRAIAHDAKYLAVSSLDEAITLRYKGIKTPILVLGYIFSDQLLAAKNNNITITLTSILQAKEIINSQIDGLKIHVKVDTGMNRIGFKNIIEIQEAIAILKSANDIEGIYTHFLESGIDNNPVTIKQFNLFKKIVKQINHSFKYIHTENSDAILNFNDDISNAVRAGIAMFGISSYQTDLRPVCSLYTKIINIKQVPKGETISYSGTYTTSAAEWIATIPIGYADGFIRKNQDRQVFIKEQPAQVVGRICMDQAMLKVDKPYPIGTIVEIFGPHISITDVAKYLDTIPYEVLTSISDRITRIYRREFRIIAIENSRLDDIATK